jgi:hypothetical protein
MAHKSGPHSEASQAGAKEPRQNTSPRDDKNLLSLDISEFGGLRSAQHADVDAGIFSDQFAGTSPSQCSGVDFSCQQD